MADVSELWSYFVLADPSDASDDIENELAEFRRKNRIKSLDYLEIM